MDGSVHSAGGVRKGSILAHGEREEMVAAEGGAIDAACDPKPKMPLLLKVFGVLCIVGGAVSIPSGVLAVVVIVRFLQSGGLAEEALTPLAVTVVLVLAQAAMLVLFILLGVRLLRNKRRYAALTAEVLMAFAAVAPVCNIMLNGTDVHIVPTLVILVLLFFVSGYVDPSLSEERELQRKLRDMETRDQAEEGTLGLDSTGRGYIALNFFNVFWIFVVCSVLGLIIEVVYHFVIVVPGEYQDRAGMLFGPFSPIYGVGAVLMTMALNRFHDKPVPVIFLVSAVIGGAFEFFVSWFMETAFGAVAWDYTGTFLSIDGRTNGMFMAHAGRAVGKGAPAEDARRGELDSLEAALYRDRNRHGAHARERHHDAAIARLLVRTAIGACSRNAHRTVLRHVFRQRFHGESVREHDHQPR